MKHYHTLRRVKLKNSTELFMCADSECTWTRRREFLLGKKFKCPYCGEIYIATTEALRRKLPHCKECTNERITKPSIKRLLPIPAVSEDKIEGFNANSEQPTTRE